MSSKPLYRFVIRIEDPEAAARADLFEATCENDGQAIEAARLFAESRTSVSLWRGDLMMWSSKLE
ncbi:MAG: hypothetical protein R3C27_00290 [Hyphomonadaceae bacterium]